jgi:hypothetical protein
MVSIGKMFLTNLRENESIVLEGSKHVVMPMYKLIYTWKINKLKSGTGVAVPWLRWLVAGF